MSPTETPSSPPAGRSWRDIRQEVTPLAMSRKGRSRRRLEWFKVITLIALIGAGGWGLYSLIHSWETDRAALATAVHSEPIRDVVLIDQSGVLSKKWLLEMLALPKNASLMSVDLAKLRDKLLTVGQVRAVAVTRYFPDKLVVTIEERTPLLRVMASENDGPAKQLLVAPDGVVYEGINYNREMLASLPWLAGVRLVKGPAGKLEPVAGMGDVSALLDTAKNEVRKLYDTWLIISLERLESRDEIVVKAQDIPEIVFSRKRDFKRQLAQLDYVIDSVNVMPEPMLLSVNLSLEGQVPVKMHNSPDELAKLPADTFSTQPSQQRKSKRDL